MPPSVAVATIFGVFTSMKFSLISVSRIPCKIALLASKTASTSFFLRSRNRFSILVSMSAETLSATPSGSGDSATFKISISSGRISKPIFACSVRCTLPCAQITLSLVSFVYFLKFSLPIILLISVSCANP